MNRQLTHGIVLRRVAYGEADRILTVLTPQHGKLSLMAKGVRRVKSKMAGAIELFSISELTYIPGHSGLHRLVSARLIQHYGTIVEDVNRTMLGYELLKLLQHVTEDEPESDYYALLQATLEALDDDSSSVDLVRTWCSAQLLRLTGHQPNLLTTSDGSALAPGITYAFDYDSVSFAANDRGEFHPDHIKYLRLLFGQLRPGAIARVQGGEGLLAVCAPMVLSLRQFYLGV